MELNTAAYNAQAFNPPLSYSTPPTNGAQAYPKVSAKVKIRSARFMVHALVVVVVVVVVAAGRDRGIGLFVVAVVASAAAVVEGGAIQKRACMKPL
tara:strand:- start:401 stop:688 length:288 start_codon:yes stop_codon:yes gene_type:complete